jgi:serine protease
MKRPAIGKVLVLCAALSLPALAAAPATGAVPAMKSARVIVQFKSDSSLTRESTLAARSGEMPHVQHAVRLSQRLGIALRDGNAVAPRTQVVFGQGVSSADLVARLKADPEVEFAEVDARVRRADVPNDPLYGAPGGGVTPVVGQWYLRVPGVNGEVASIDAQRAWDITLGSPAIVVAVLDTGVRPNHPDLVGKLVRGYDFVSEDGTNNFATANDGDGRDADPSDPGDWVTESEVGPGGPFDGEACEGDSSWHGTHTSALIAASTNNSTGMASVGRNVRVLPVRVLGKCGGFTSDVVAGMYWAAGLAIPASPSTLGTAPTNTNPAKVLNLSLGSSAPTCSNLYQQAVTAVTNAGASVVVSAGNGLGTAVGQPANCIGAIAVGGVRHIGTKVGFSDVGTQVAVSAPAGNCQSLDGACLFPILSATNSGTTGPVADGYSDSFNFSVGTSFSAPQAAGVAALMLSRNPNFAPALVRSTIQATARMFPQAVGIPMCQPPSGTPQDECNCTTGTCGAGMLDARAAVAAVTPPATARALIFTTVAMPSPNSDITVDGSTSVGSNGAAITQYEWSLENSGGIASLQSPTNAATATVATTGVGTFSIRLLVTDANGLQDTRVQAVSVASVDVQSPNSPPPDSGGGSLSWPWLLALGVAVAVLRPRRRV